MRHRIKINTLQTTIYNLLFKHKNSALLLNDFGQVSHFNAPVYMNAYKARQAIGGVESCYIRRGALNTLSGLVSHA